MHWACRVRVLLHRTLVIALAFAVLPVVLRNPAAPPHACTRRLLLPSPLRSSVVTRAVRDQSKDPRVRGWELGRSA